MKTQRHHFSASSSSDRLHAYVPDEGGQEAALKRLLDDDPLWRQGDVQYHGVVDWYERIDFRLLNDSAASTAREKLGLGDPV
ncbi:hypothetical protein AJ87_02860 [Rhizobium yanglingense]|nr:hypothetical protein AJ87_02860 [Rhizobium yanglingense]